MLSNHWFYVWKYIDSQERVLAKLFYGDALEIEFIDNNLKYSREKKFGIIYKGNILPHKYLADFIVYDKIILELKQSNL